MALLKNSAPVMAPEWSAKCWDFLQHWKSIRTGALMPTTEAMLDTMPPGVVSTVYIVELTDCESRVRFEGQDLITQWGVDLTGRDICSLQPASVQAQILAINRVLVAHPCGYISQSNYLTSRQLSVSVSIVRLPLAVRAGRPPRLIACIDETAHASKDDDVAWEVYEVVGHAWLDVGAGVPHRPPKPVSH